MIDLDKIKAGDILKWEECGEIEYYKVINITNNNVIFEVIEAVNPSANGQRMEAGLKAFNCCINVGNNPLIEEE